MRKIILFGTGNFGKEAYRYFGEDNILCFCDNDSEVQGRELFGKSIIAPCDIKRYESEGIVVLAASEHICREMKYQMLREIRIDRFFPYLMLKYYIDKYSCIEEFMDDCENDAGIYRLMYRLMEDQSKQLEERIDFLTEHTDIRALTPATGKLRKRQLDLLKFAQKFGKDIEELKVKLILGEGNLLGAVRHGGFIPWDDDMDFLILREDYVRLVEHFKKMNRIFIPDESPYELKKAYDTLKEKLLRDGNDYELCLNGSFLKAVCMSSDGSYLYLDFFPLDYYQDSVTFDKLCSYIKELRKQKKDIKKIRELIDFYEVLRSGNSVTSEIPTKKIQFGLECADFALECRDFLSRRDVLPLVRISFENTEFWAPHQPEMYCKNEYGDIWQWPEDAGGVSHDAIRRYIPYQENPEAYYIREFDDLEKKIDGCLKDKRPVIVEKYSIRDFSEYRKIVQKLEEMEMPYQIYS